MEQNHQTGWARTSAFRRDLPTIEQLRTLAKRRIPPFAYDFMEGGTGTNIAPKANREALDDVKFAWTVTTPGRVSTKTTFFGREYSAPFGIAPIGMDGAIWPGASQALAHAGKHAGIPYIAGTLACAGLEELAAIYPGMWFQLYGFPQDDHKITLDLIRRAEALNLDVLVVTMDAPLHAKRNLDLVNGVTVPFRPSLKLAYGALRKPFWLKQLLKAGQPSCPTMAQYSGATSLTSISSFVRDRVVGAFGWEDIKRIRSRWKGALILKGIMTTDDARLAIEVGVDGIVVSNHGGRQLDASLPTIRALPAIVEAVNSRVQVFMDGGIRSGLDVARAISLGADGVLAGRAFLTGLAALGDEGGVYVADLLGEELHTAIAQIGFKSLPDLRRAQKYLPIDWQLR
ncbi:MAG: alpha-hydroxy acid oxidase [Pseudomonas sp.]